MTGEAGLPAPAVEGEPAVGASAAVVTDAARARRLEAAVLLAIVLLAALTRLPGLDQRGRWDADQGHDMLVLREMRTDGTIPLLGPKTSIGTFHHGAVYYYLLAPAAIASAADPVAVTGEIALFGIAAVAATWWLARLLGGPLAAVAAGLLAAVSPAGIDESTFIWNPNLIPAAAALAFAATVMARRTGRARWWLLAGLGAMVTMQCHVLGIVIVLPLGWAWATDLRRRRRAGQAVRGVLRGGIGALVVVGAGFLPLLAYELGHDFTETRAILDYLAGGGRAAAAGVPSRIVTVGLRSITWPIAGLITDRLWASLAAAMAVSLLIAAAVAGRRRTDAGRLGASGGWPTAPVDLPSTRWLAGALGASILALAIFAPSLAVVTPGLPNDHYHAFLDPVVLALAGIGLARLAGGLRSGGPIAVGGAVAGGVALLLAGIAVTAWPPPVSPDGGWPIADVAAAHVIETTGGAPFALDGIPPFKSADALRFPLERRGAPVLPAASPAAGASPGAAASPGDAAAAPGDAAAADVAGAGVAVVVCDPLFDEVVGAPCGGPAEDRWLAGTCRTDLALVERFEAGPRRVISVFAVAP